jgi:hypothetical protein
MLVNPQLNLLLKALGKHLFVSKQSSRDDRHCKWDSQEAKVLIPYYKSTINDELELTEVSI